MAENNVNSYKQPKCRQSSARWCWRRHQHCRLLTSTLLAAQRWNYSCQTTIKLNRLVIRLTDGSNFAKKNPSNFSQKWAANFPKRVSTIGLTSVLPKSKVFHFAWAKESVLTQLRRLHGCRGSRPHRCAAQV